MRLSLLIHVSVMARPACSVMWGMADGVHYIQWRAVSVEGGGGAAAVPGSHRAVISNGTSNKEICIARQLGIGGGGIQMK